MSRLARIENCLQDHFQPSYLLVTDESHNHSAGRETHFNVVLVSSRFDGLRLVQRHRAVFGVLEAELQTGLHALSLRLLDPKEAEGATLENPQPACLGGSKADLPGASRDRLPSG